jgi:GntR family transcriptional regulator
MAGFREIAERLRRAIETGQYPPGVRIPTEHELAEEYAVSRETIRRALALLKADGLLVTARSQGTRVRRPPIRLAVTRYAAVTNPARQRSDLGPWETACADQGVDGRTVVTGVDREPADATVARRLGRPEGTELVHRARLMLVGDRVAQIQDSWMPVDLVEGTPLAGTEKIVGGAYAAMAAAGFAPDRVTEEVTARQPTTEEQSRMQTDGAPVFEIWRTTRDAAGRVVEVLRVVANASLSTLVYDDLPIRQDP